MNKCMCVFDQFLLNKDQIWCFNNECGSYPTARCTTALYWWKREREMTRKLRPCGLTKIFLTWNEPKWFGGVFGHHPWSVLISLIVRQAVMCLWNYYCKHQCGARFHGVVIQSVLSTNAKPACTYLPQINLRLHTQLLPNLGVAKQRYSYPPPTHYGMCATMPLTTKNSTLSCS